MVIAMKKLLLFLLFLFLPLTAFADLEVHFLDVGHGDSTLIICDGEAMLIDGGDAQASDLIYTVLRDQGVTDLKYVVATHPQADHVGGLPAAFHAATVHALYTPVLEYDTERFATLLDKAEEMSVPVIVPTQGDVLTLGGATIKILSPGKQYSEINDMSIVLRLDYEAHSVLFTGDITKGVEMELVNAGADLDVDVLKVAHHGSDTATGIDFVAATSPQYAVISCSTRYDNPDEAVLEALYGCCYTRVIRTDINGNILFHSDGEKLTVTTEAWYIGNINSEIYHRSNCNSADKMKESNKTTFYTTHQADYEGYRPCKNCSP